MSSEILDKIKTLVAIVAPEYPCISRIGVFGSCARGDYENGSDVDLLYDYDYSAKDSTHQFLSFVEEFLDGITPHEADFVYIENLMESGDEEFKQSAFNDVVWIYNGA
jgi:predicted nucleotidyltransferase